MNILAFLMFLLHSTMCEYDNRVITSLKYSMYRVKPSIVNGEPTGSDSIPFLVSIKEPNGIIAAHELLWTNLCGGSIIGRNKILTAAHCFEGNAFFYHHNPHLLRVFAGSNKTYERHSGSTDTRPQLQVRKIVDIVLHRDFHFPSNDIALAFTNVDWNFTDYVNSVATAKRNLDYSICIVAGFGRVGNDAFALESEVLLVGRIRTLTRWKCSVLWQLNMDSYVCTDEFLADVAKGDSGGPLACYGTDDPAQIPGEELLVGVVSGKNFDKTTLFTRVSAFSDWIESNVACTLAPTLLTIISLLLIYLLFLLSQLIFNATSLKLRELIVPLHGKEGY